MRFVAILFAIACMLASTGCAVTRRSVSMESGSKMPWFNMELMPKRRPPAPETTRISRNSSIPLEPMPAKLVKEDASPKKDDTWWQRLTGTEKHKAIKLPRTDLETASANQASSISELESEPLEF